MVDYTMLASKPYIDINAIGNALAVRQHLQDQPLRQMQAAGEIKRLDLTNKILADEEVRKALAERVRQANIEELLNMGANGPQAAAGAANIPPPQNALAGASGSPTAAPVPQGWRPPMALPPEGGSALTAPPQAAPAPAARIPYSPEAEGRYMAQEGQRVAAMKEAKDTFSSLLKSAVDTGSQEMVDSLIRVAKKSPALKSMVGFLGDPDGPEEQRLRVVGKGETETESTFTQEMLAGLAKNASNETIRKAIEGAKPGTYAIKTKGSQVVGFKPAVGAAKPLSDIGKLEHDRDAKIDALVAEGKYRTKEEAKQDPEVKRYDQEITRKAAGKDDPKARYLEIVTRRSMNDPKNFPTTPEDMKFASAYEKEKTLGPMAYGEQRFKMVMDIPISVYDTNTGAVELKTRGEINEGNKENTAKGLSSRYVGGEMASKLKSRLAIFDEIDASAKQVEDAVKPINFTQKQLAKFAVVMKVDDDGSAIRNFIKSDFGKTLTQPEIEYVTAVKNLRESAFSLRTIAGMGQGSDMLRNAIASVVPGTTTPSKAYLDSAMKRFKIQVAQLRGGIPGIGAETQRKAAEKAEAEKAANVVPRKPGESIADYLRRTGGK